MSEDKKDNPKGLGSDAGKKPYAKPSVQSEPIYETLALACGKLPGQGGVCNAAPRRS
jgi:hypothetical protein